jgi:hypothetical protein
VASVALWDLAHRLQLKAKKYGRKVRYDVR